MARGKRCFIDYENEMKECSVCGAVRSFSEFYKNKNTKRGLVAHCIECDRKRKDRKFVKKKCMIDYERRLKECSKCGKILPFSSFSAKKTGVGGLNPPCKECERVKTGSTRRQVKIDYENEMKGCSVCGGFYPFDHFYARSRSKSGLSSSCKSCEASRAQSFKNKEVRRLYQLKNREKIKKYKQANILEFNKVQNSYRKKRKQEDLNYKLATNLRSRINRVLKGEIKAGSSVNDLGCSVEDFIRYLEERFYKRSNGQLMDWANYGREGWHIDHVKPLTSFDLSNREQFLQACHYTNMQPLWVEDNLAKGASLC